MTPTSKRSAIATLLAAAVCGVYARMLGHAFVAYDTPDYITSNPFVSHGLSWETVRWAFTRSYAANWHPLTWLSHALDVQLFGFEPTGHHAVNLALHALNTVILFFVLERMTAATWRSAVVAALFGLHPLHVESVAWVVERKDLLSACFGFLSIGAYAKWAKERSRSAYARSLVWLALGLMSKPMLVTWPFVLALLDVWPLARVGSSVKRLALEKLPFLALAILSSIATVVAQHARGAIADLDQVPLRWRLANAVFACAQYLRKTLWPSDLAVYYPHLRGGIPTAYWVSSLVVVLAFTVLAVACRKRAPHAFTGWFWYLGTLVPVIGIVQVGGQSMADRYTYLPLVGVFIACVWSASAAAQRIGLAARAVGAVVWAMLAVFACLSWRQVEVWRDTTTLCEHALAVTEHNCVAHNLLGYEYVERGELERARSEFEAAVADAPGDLKAVRNLGVTLVRLGRPQEAERWFRRVVELAPNDASSFDRLGEFLALQGRREEARAALERALAIDPGFVSAMHNMGKLDEDTGRLDVAQATFERVLDVDPTFAPAHASLARIAMREGRFGESAERWKRALELQPQDFDALLGLARARLGERRTREAVDSVRAALRVRPNSAAAQAELAWMFATSDDASVRDPAAAIEWGERAASKKNGERAPRVLGALAAAYASAGRFEDAVEVAGRAAASARDGGEKDLAARIDRRAAAYRQRTAASETVQ